MANPSLLASSIEEHTPKTAEAVEELRRERVEFLIDVLRKTEASSYIIAIGSNKQHPDFPGNGVVLAFGGPKELDQLLKMLEQTDFK